MAVIITTTIITMTSIAIMTITTAIPMLMTTNKPRRPRRRAVVRADAVSDVTAPAPGDRSGLQESEAAALYRLMTWLSPAFPVGAFSYSSGIEWAVEAGDIRDAVSLQGWLAAMLADGAGFCDGVFLAQTHRAASSDDDAALADIAELASAFVPSRERHLETTSQGRAFIEIARAAWNCDPLGSADFVLRRRHRLSRRGWSCLRCACDFARARAPRFSSRGDLELDLRRRAPCPSWTNR